MACASNTMEPPPPLKPQCSPLAGEILPSQTELSMYQIEFLNQLLSTHEDLLNKAPLLLTDLTKSYTDLESDFIKLQRNLTKRTVSWISHSLGAKSSVTNLNHMLENLSLHTCQHGYCSRKTKKILSEEMPQLIKCLKRIETIGKYVDIALELEALVGDLEDAIYSIGDLHGRNIFSAKILSSTDFELKQERLLTAIKVMNKIEDVLVGVIKFHPQWLRLLESVDVRVNKCLAVVRPQILVDHRTLLASLGWPPKLSSSKIVSGEITSLPNPLVLMEGDRRKCYSQSFLGLCALQHLHTRREDRQHDFPRQKDCTTSLWAIDELVSPIASRLEHHFAKWVEQPELILALVYKITRDFIMGIDDVLQPLIDKARLGSYSAREAWISAMVHMLSGFLSKSVVSDLARRFNEKDMKLEVASSWLHLIDHIFTFDKWMQSLLLSELHYFLKSGRPDEPSRGVSLLGLFCDRPDWLKIWTKIELKDAWKKLKLDLKDNRAWSIDKDTIVGSQHGAESEQFLLATKEDYRAPLIAESAVEIAWEMIERGQTLPDIFLRVKFIRSTAGKFLWHFINVLVLRCKSTEFSLDFPNDGFIKVCGSINAARYVEGKMQEWSDDVNFSEMRLAERNLGRNGNEDGAGDDIFFWEEVKSLMELEMNWLMDIITVILHHFEEHSWEYLQHAKRFDDLKENITSAVIDTNVSQDLVGALDTTRSELNILKSSLNPKDFLDLWRSVADGLDHFVMRSILTGDFHFSSKGVDQFEADMHGLYMVFQPFCARPEAFFPCIRETLRLLRMSRDEENHFQAVASDAGNRTNWLHSAGILHLPLDQVDKILRKKKLRI